MCIVIYKPKGKIVNRDIMEECWKCNNDGGGYMYAIDNDIKITKEMDSFNKFWEKYTNEIINQRLEDKLKIVLHFRIRSHGNIDIDNCHPFYIGHDRYMAFCHNGMIKGVDVPTASEKSDTVLFGEKILDLLPKTWIKNEGIIELVKEYAGSFSKLAFMDKKGEVFLTNEDKGTWDEGIWYSNGSYKIPIRTPVIYNNWETAWRSRGYSGRSRRTFTIFDKTKGYSVRPEFHTDPTVKQMWLQYSTEEEIQDYLDGKTTPNIDTTIDDDIDVTLYSIPISDFLKEDNIEIKGDSDEEDIPESKSGLGISSDCNICSMPIFMSKETDTKECWYCYMTKRERIEDGRVANLH